MAKCCLISELGQELFLPQDLCSLQLGFGLGLVCQEPRFLWVEQIESSILDETMMSEPDTAYTMGEMCDCHDEEWTENVNLEVLVRPAKSSLAQGVRKQPPPKDEGTTVTLPCEQSAYCSTFSVRFAQ